MQLSDLVDRFVRDVCAGKTNQTQDAYRSKLRHITNYLGNDRENISQDDIDDFRIYLLNRSTKRRGAGMVNEKLSKFTIRSIFTATQTFLSWSGIKGYIPRIQLQNIKEPAIDPKAVTMITVNLLLDAAAKTGAPWEQARNTALIYVLRDTGCRVGAIARIDIDEMDLVRGLATAPDKNGQLTWLWFNRPTVTAIRSWLQLRHTLEPIDRILWTGAKRSSLTTMGIRHVLSRLAKAGGVTGRCNPHSFRHAFARDAILAGADLGRVSELMGHHGILVTHKYYARWAKIELKQFHEKFSPGRDLPDPRDLAAKP